MKDDYLDPASPWTSDEFMRRQRQSLQDNWAAYKRQQESKRLVWEAQNAKRRAALTGERMTVRGKRLESDQMIERARERQRERSARSAGLERPTGAAGKLMFDFMRRGR
jgi:predicted GIY-YIG superfamily endonuclease